jgi:cell wall-associated NlpC family hydrolase
MLPAAVATFAAAGTIAGVMTAAMSDRPSSALDSGAATSAGTPRATASSSLFDLPAARPASGNLPGPALGTTVTDSVLAAVEKGTTASVAPLTHTQQADLLVVSPASLPSSLIAQASKLSGVTAAEQIEAVRMKLNGSYTSVLGVDPSVFRSFAAKPTAASNALWDGVAGGGVAVSYTMGKLDKLPLGGTITAAGAKTEQLRVAAFGTLGIGGVNAVVSDAVARSLGAPSGNAIVISTDTSDFTAVQAALGRLIPHGASVEPLVTVTTTNGGTTTNVSTSAGAGSTAESSAPASAIDTMLKAAMSRLGMPYVWGGAGPTQFDCSGLVQWSFARAGVTMPRVAADQALTGPAVPASQLKAGDLLFYHTDPTDPGYISHVAIYIGNGWMIQAPEPGKNVEVVPADFGSEFAGAVRVNPAQAAAVASRVA